MSSQRRPAGPRYAAGTVVQSRSTAVSKTEEQVRNRLVAAGLSVHKGRSAIQCGFEPSRSNYPLLTPDILISKTKVCVEVDSGFTHAGMEGRDTTRNALLADVGWQVVRLRLGGLAPIGEHDVVVEAQVASLEAISALVEAVADAVAGRPGTVRRITKKKIAESRPVSKLGAMAAHKYYDNAFYVSWSINGTVLRLVAMDSGRYLARATGQEAPRFVRHLGLDEVPRKKWRTTLLPILEGMTLDQFEPVATFPWGEQIFVGEQASAVLLSHKFHLGVPEWSTTANIEGFDSWAPTSISARGKVVVELHPAAVTDGWRFTSVVSKSGYRGPYQRIDIERAPTHSPGQIR